ncbi:Calcineurin-like phosphoesterase family protein [Acanthocheilonema viteae]
MANAPVQFTCKTLNGQTLNNIIVSILEKSFRDGISALVWMNREIMIAMIHQAIDLINRSESMFINVAEDLLEQKMVFVVGSIDGDLINLVTLLKNEMPPTAYYIFLGDYLDCFKPSRIDALLLLLGLKLRHPRYICLFRGHHETYEMCKAIGFDKAVGHFKFS